MANTLTKIERDALLNNIKPLEDDQIVYVAAGKLRALGVTVPASLSDDRPVEATVGKLRQTLTKKPK